MDEDSKKCLEYYQILPEPDDMPCVVKCEYSLHIFKYIHLCNLCKTPFLILLNTELNKPHFLHDEMILYIVRYK